MIIFAGVRTQFSTIDKDLDFIYIFEIYFNKIAFDIRKKVWSKKVITLLFAIKVIH